MNLAFALGLLIGLTVGFVAGTVLGDRGGELSFKAYLKDVVPELFKKEE